MCERCADYRAPLPRVRRCSSTFMESLFEQPGTYVDDVLFIRLSAGHIRPKMTIIVPSIIKSTIESYD